MGGGSETVGGANNISASHEGIAHASEGLSRVMLLAAVNENGYIMRGIKISERVKLGRRTLRASMYDVRTERGGVGCKKCTKLVE